MKVSQDVQEIHVYAALFIIVKKKKKNPKTRGLKVCQKEDLLNTLRHIYIIEYCVLMK